MDHVIPSLNNAATFHLASAAARRTPAALSGVRTVRTTMPQSASPMPSTAPAATAPAAATPSVPDFRALFTSTGTPGTPEPVQKPAPTAESVFGPNPWIANPTGVAPNGQSYAYNPFYFATQQTAAKVAQMVGGTVVESNVFTPNGGGGFSQQQPNNMVKLPDGRLINPGLVASFFTHGYPQSYLDSMVAAEIRST